LTQLCLTTHPFQFSHTHTHKGDDTLPNVDRKCRLRGYGVWWGKQREFWVWRTRLHPSAPRHC